MKFRTEIPLYDFPVKIRYTDSIFGLGSCFIDNIKTKLDYYQFQNRLNPFGTVFNPVSIQKILHRVVNQEFIDEKDLFFHQNLWKSFEWHSSFNQPDKEQYLSQINAEIKTAYEYLPKARWLFLTLGTAWVYKHNESGKIVNNCHKVLQKNFEKLLLSPTEITHSLRQIINLVSSLNPSINILWSISPVRHLRDGFVENQQSKAHLITAVHQVITNRQNFYFPSYEIMMDDLRDYRFYKDDYIHPNQLAINYIWDYFKQSLIASPQYETLKKVEKIRAGLAHKSFFPESVENKQRLEKLHKEIKQLQRQYPWMVF